jgi:hypothetical protein
MLDDGIPEERRGEEDEAENQPEERVEYPREPLREEKEERHDHPRHKKRDETNQERQRFCLSVRVSLAASMEGGNREEVDFCCARESFRCASEISHF